MAPGDGQPSRMQREWQRPPLAALKADDREARVWIEAAGAPTTVAIPAVSEATLAISAIIMVSPIIMVPPVIMVSPIMRFAGPGENIGEGGGPVPGGDLAGGDVSMTVGGVAVGAAFAGAAVGTEVRIGAGECARVSAGAAGDTPGGAAGEAVAGVAPRGSDGAVGDAVSAVSVGDAVSTVSVGGAECTAEGNAEGARVIGVGDALGGLAAAAALAGDLSVAGATLGMLDGAIAGDAVDSGPNGASVSAIKGVPVGKTDARGTAVGNPDGIKVCLAEGRSVLVAGFAEG